MNEAGNQLSDLFMAIENKRLNILDPKKVYHGKTTHSSSNCQKHSKRKYNIQQQAIRNISPGPSLHAPPLLIRLPEEKKINYPVKKTFIDDLIKLSSKTPGIGQYQLKKQNKNGTRIHQIDKFTFLDQVCALSQSIPGPGAYNPRPIRKQKYFKFNSSQNKNQKMKQILNSEQKDENSRKRSLPDLKLKVLKRQPSCVFDKAQRFYKGKQVFNNNNYLPIRSWDKRSLYDRVSSLSLKNIYYQKM